GAGPADAAGQTEAELVNAASQPDRPERVAEALADYYERLDRGEKVDRGRFLEEHADVADQLLESLRVADLIDDLVGQPGGSFGGAPSGSRSGAPAQAEALSGSSLSSHSSTTVVEAAVVLDEAEPLVPPEEYVVRL